MGGPQRRDVQSLSSVPSIARSVARPAHIRCSFLSYRSTRQKNAKDWLSHGTHEGLQMTNPNPPEQNPYGNGDYPQQSGNQYPQHANGYPQNGNGYPQNGNGYPQQYAPAPQPEKKKKGGCMKWGAIIAGVLILLVILGSLIGGDDSESSNGDQNNAANSAGDGDTTVAVGETINMDRMDATVTRFFNAGATVLGENNVCADVTLTNTHDGALDIGQFDWKLTDPAGVTRDSTISEFSNFEFAQLNPGANYEGTICFDSDGAPGEYKLEYQEGFIGGSATWTGTL